MKEGPGSARPLLLESDDASRFLGVDDRPDDAVATVLAMVDDLNLVCVLVEVDEEVMAEQVGLHECVLLGHRLHLDFLEAHEQIVVFLGLGRDDIGDIELVGCR